MKPGANHQHDRDKTPPPKQQPKGPCYNCGKRGHLARDCTEQKQVQNRESRLVFPNTRRIPRDVSTLDRSVIKKYTEAECKAAREIERLGEILLDDLFQVAELTESLKDVAGGTSYTFTSRLDNSKVSYSLNTENHAVARKRQMINDFTQEINTIDAALKSMYRNFVTLAFEEGKAQRFWDVPELGGEAEAMVQKIRPEYQAVDPAEARVKVAVSFVNNFSRELEKLRKAATQDGTDSALKKRARMQARKATNGVTAAVNNTQNTQNNSGGGAPPPRVVDDERRRRDREEADERLMQQAMQQVDPQFYHH